MNPAALEPIPHSLKITFKFKSVTLFELEISDSEPIGEIRSLINDHPFLKLHPNFKMTHNAKRITEVLCLSAQLVKPDSALTFELQPDFFTNQTAQRHVNQAAEFFLAPEYFLNEGMMEFNILLGKTDFIQNMINRQDTIPINIVLDDVIGNKVSKLSQTSFLKIEQPVGQFFVSLSYSRFNPPCNHMSIQEDFFYLDFLAKEKRFFCVSASKKGFYVNESTETCFSPKPASSSYTSLFELLSEISPEFKIDLDNCVSFDSQDSHDRLINHPLIIKPICPDSCTFAEPGQVTLWTTTLKQLKETTSEFKNGMNMKVYRDWNEEFQSYRSLPAEDTMQQLQKTKILRKVFKDFSRSAQEIARAIVNNHFSAVNPTDQKVEECFVFNNFFITYAEDRLDWETPRSETTPSTYSNINSDLKNLQQIYSQDMTDVNVINTCAVDYLGLRLVVQTMITGILHFDQKTWNCYGSIDDGKTFNDNIEFAPIFEELCKSFKLKTNCLFKDAAGTEFKIHGSPEVKGIKAGDGRRYVMDLMKLSPRDLNFPRVKEEEGCLIRPELIRNYFFMNSVEEMYAKNAEEIKNENQQKNQETKPEESMAIESEEQKPGAKETKTTKLEYFNPNLGSLIQNEDDGLKTLETEQLKAVSVFIIENAIPFFKSELCSNPTSIPIEMDGLVDLLHKYGINVRYLGKILNSFEENKERFFKLLFQRIIIVRSTRKWLRKLALQFSTQEVLNITIHFLNCMLGDSEIVAHIDLKLAPTHKNGHNSSEKTTTDKNNSAETKNKRKNKKKKTLKIVPCLSEPNNEYLRYSSSEIFKQIIDIAQKRYGADFTNFKSFSDFSCLSENKEKTTFLREFAKAAGITLANRQYSFTKSASGFEYPLKLKDVLNVYPRIKCPNFHIEGLKYSYKSVEAEMNDKNYENAFNLLVGCQNLVLNTYGMYNSDFIYTASKLANLHFVKGQTEKAIQTQMLVVKINERVFGLDHFNTGFSIIELSNYTYEGRRFDNSVQLHLLAALIFDLVGGPVNPSSLLCLQEVHLLYSQIKQLSNSAQAMEELLKRNESIYGETDEHLLFLLGKLASLKGDMGSFKEASILQARKSLILKKILKINASENNEYARKIIDEKITDSEFVKNIYVQKSKEVALEAITADDGIPKIKKNKVDKK